MIVSNPKRVVTKKDLSDFYNAIKPYLLNLLTTEIVELSNVNYDTAYNKANQHISSNEITYVGTILDVYLSSNSIDSYDSTSTDIANLWWSTMHKNLNEARPLALFNNSIQIIRASNNKQSIKFLKPCYVVYSHAPADINNMPAMKNYGNVFSTIYFNSGRTLDLATHSTPENSFVSVYTLN